MDRAEVLANIDKLKADPVKLPDNITLEQAFIMGYEQGYEDASAPVPNVPDADALPHGFILGNFYENTDKWGRILIGDIVVNDLRGNSTWTVDRTGEFYNRNKSGWKVLVDGETLVEAGKDDEHLPGLGGFESLDSWPVM